MADDDKKSVDEFLEDVHGEQPGGDGTGLQFSTAITKDDVEAYINRHPFLQLLNLDPTFEDFDKVTLLESSGGWTVQDFGDALSTSQGELFFDDFGLITLFEDAHETRQQNQSGAVSDDEYGDEDAGDIFGEDEQGEGSGGWDDAESDLRPGSGTVVKQAVDTANEMVDLIKERWKGLHIVAGAEIMKWAAWKAARGYGMEVYGYEPTNEARKRRTLVERAEMQKGMGKQL